MSMDNSIVITGIGIVSAIGNDKSTVLQSLLDGRSGIERSARWLNLPVGEVNLSDNDMKTMLGIDPAKDSRFIKDGKQYQISEEEHNRIMGELVKEWLKMQEENKENG